MKHEESTKARREALRRAAELEVRWQDAVAQRRRASELFSGRTGRGEPREPGEEDAR